MMIKTNPVYIIAEAGVNHNGSLKLGKELIDAAVAAGADAVKFQTFKADKISSKQAPKAAYQLETTSQNESQLEMLRKLELSEESHLELMKYCKVLGIEFLSTPFDSDSLKFLVGTLNLPKVKIPSGEITNAPFLLEIARSGRPVILSTGMSTLDEIRTALGVLAYGYNAENGKPTQKNFEKCYQSSNGQKMLREKVVLLHCTTEYPAVFSDVNLRAIETLQKEFGLPVGLSDHTTGIAVSLAAVAIGASIIEKHFTLDRNLPGPDHRASITPEELKQLVQSIREIELALGSVEKKPAPAEIKNRAIARKSLVAACPIKKGELFTTENLTAKRPGSGISPLRYWDYLGKRAERDYQADEMVME